MYAPVDEVVPGGSGERVEVDGTVNGRGGCIEGPAATAAASVPPPPRSIAATAVRMAGPVAATYMAQFAMRCVGCGGCACAG